MHQDGEDIMMQRNGAEQNGCIQDFGSPAGGATEYELVPKISLRKSTKTAKKEPKKNQGYQIN